MKEYEIAIVGGGPSGLMAAVATLGKNIVILEKNDSLASKLLLTGGGRCNLTNNKPIKKLLNSFHDKNFLKHSFYTLTNEKLMSIFENQGLYFIEEDDNRIFPETERAVDVLDTLTDYFEDVDIKCNFKVESIDKKDDKFIINNDIIASCVIIATGGITYPQTGSTGDGYYLTSHEVSNIKYGLSPLITRDDLKDYAGINLYNVSVSYKKSEIFGDVLITHQGLTGPAILNISNLISYDNDYNLLDNKNIVLDNVKIAIDLTPDYTRDELSEKFILDFQAKGKTLLKNYLKYLLTNSFIPLFLEKAGLDGEVKLANITKKDKNRLINSLKGLEFEIVGFMGELSKVTVGGIKIDDINSKTMESKLVDGLYFAGEVLEPVGYTGGYNLKIAFSTGYLAGMSASKSLD